MSCYVLHLVFQYGIGGTFDFNTTFVLPRTYKKMRAVQGNEREGCDYNDRPWNLSWHSRTREHERKSLEEVEVLEAGKLKF